MAKRVDANQKAIVSRLRRRGYSVAITSDLGRGFPDIVAGKHGLNWLFEIKNPEYGGELTEHEARFHRTWRGQIDVIESAEDALKLMGE